MKLVWLDLLSYKNRCSLRFDCLFRFKFILEYSRANFAIRIACTSPANTYLKYESLPQLRSWSVSSTKTDCSLISARTARTHRHSVAVWIDYLF